MSIHENRSERTAHFHSNPLPIQETVNIQKNPPNRSNFVYQVERVFHPQDKSPGLTPLLFHLRYLITNRSFFSPGKHEKMALELNKRQNSFLIDYDFDRKTGRLVMLLRSFDEYLIVDNCLTITRERKVVVKTEDGCLLGIKYFCEYNTGKVLVISDRNVYQVQLDDGLLSDDNTVLLVNPLYNTNMNMNTSSKVIGIFNFPNISSISISRVNSFIVFWSVYSKSITVLESCKKDYKSYYIGHFFDNVLFSSVNTENLILFDSERDNSCFTIINLKKGFKQCISVNEKMLKRELSYMNEQLIPNNKLSVSFNGENDDVIVVRNNCLLIFRNKALEDDIFNIFISPFNYQLSKFEYLNRILKGYGNRGFVLTEPFALEANSESEEIYLYTHFIQNNTIHMFIINYNTKSYMFSSKIVENKLGPYNAEDSYSIESRFKIHRTGNVTLNNGKQFFLFIRKPNDRTVDTIEYSTMLRIFRVDFK